MPNLKMIFSSQIQHQTQYQTQVQSHPQIKQVINLNPINTKRVFSNMIPSFNGVHSSGGCRSCGSR